MIMLKGIGFLILVWIMIYVIKAIVDCDERINKEE